MPAGGKPCRTSSKINAEPAPAPTKSAVAAGDADADEDAEEDNIDDRAEVTTDRPAKETQRKEKGARDVVTPSTRTKVVPPYVKRATSARK